MQFRREESMIWYLIGGLIGVFILYKRFHLSTWAAIGYGVSLTLCVYFGIGAITGFIASSAGVDEIGSPWVFAVLFLAFLAGFIANIKRLQKRNSITPIEEPTSKIGAENKSNTRLDGDRRYKKCPYCAEYILEEAVFCRWCNQDLHNSQTIKSSLISTPVYHSSSTESKLNELDQPKKFDKTWLILTIFFVLPIFALVIWGASNNSEKNTINKPTTQITHPSYTPTTRLVNIDACYIRRKNDNSQMIVTGPYVDDVCNGLVKENPELLYLVDGPIDAEKVCEVSANEYKIVVRDISSSNLDSADLCKFVNSNKNGGNLNLFSKLRDYFANLDVNDSSSSTCTKWSDVTKNDIGKEICVYGIVVNAYYSENYKGYFILFSSDPSAMYIVKYGDKVYDDLTGKCVQYTGTLGNVWDTPVMSMNIDDSLYQCGESFSNAYTAPTKQNSSYSTPITTPNSQPTIQPTVNNPVLDITIKVANHCPERHVVIFEGPVHLKYDVAPGETKEWQGAKGVYSWTVDGIPGYQSPMELWESVWTLTLCP